MTIRDELAVIRERAENATEGPWRAWKSGEVTDVPANPEDRFDVMPLTLFKDVESDDDATFIAHARTDVPRLVSALQAVVDRHVRSPLVYLGDDGEYSVCQGCARRWPCPTIRAIEEAMEAGA